ASWPDTEYDALGSDLIAKLNGESSLRTQAAEAGDEACHPGGEQDHDGDDEQAEDDVLAVRGPDERRRGRERGEERDERCAEQDAPQGTEPGHRRADEDLERERDGE